MSSYPLSVKIWLIVGLFMVFMQVIIGGITRLTGSGLSITKWEIVTGTLPPMNEKAWDEAFDLYKETPQYQKINEGMSMGQFKFIYFWEYFHRVWARSMGFVFLLPYLFFWRKGYIDKRLMRRLGIVILLAAVVASFGWIMVASGLVERPWVNAYKLTLHLSLALILFSYLYYTTVRVFQEKPLVIDAKALQWMNMILFFLVLQIILGGIMSGMKAALVYPTWPDMHGQWIPDVLLTGSEWKLGNFVMYDQNHFMPAFIQFFHRLTAYILFVLIIVFALKKKSDYRIKKGSWIMLGMAFVQVLLGILTVIHSKGIVPVGLGVYHQAGALILLLAVLYIRFSLKR